jgi:hypothetical protein
VAGAGGCPRPGAACEGAFAVTLDESVYRQVRRADLGDIAAFNAAGEALPFGPMPAEYRAPRRSGARRPGSCCRPRCCSRRKTCTCT